MTNIPFQGIKPVTKEFYIVKDSYRGINIWMYDPCTEKSADFSIRWYPIGNNKYAPKLEVFDDCWYVLFTHCQDLLEALSRYDNQAITPLFMNRILCELGYEDKTK